MCVFFLKKKKLWWLIPSSDPGILKALISLMICLVEAFSICIFLCDKNLMVNSAYFFSSSSDPYLETPGRLVFVS